MSSSFFASPSMCFATNGLSGGQNADISTNSATVTGSANICRLTANSIHSNSLTVGVIEVRDLRHIPTPVQDPFFEITNGDEFFSALTTLQTLPWAGVATFQLIGSEIHLGFNPTISVSAGILGTGSALRIVGEKQVQVTDVHLYSPSENWTPFDRGYTGSTVYPMYSILTTQVNATNTQRGDRMFSISHPIVPEKGHLIYDLNGDYLRMISPLNDNNVYEIRRIKSQLQWTGRLQLTGTVNTVVCSQLSLSLAYLTVILTHLHLMFHDVNFINCDRIVFESFYEVAYENCYFFNGAGLQSTTILSGTFDAIFSYVLLDGLFLIENSQRLFSKIVFDNIIWQQQLDGTTILTGYTISLSNASISGTMHFSGCIMYLTVASNVLFDGQNASSAAISFLNTDFFSTKFSSTAFVQASKILIDAQDSRLGVTSIHLYQPVGSTTTHYIKNLQSQIQTNNLTINSNENGKPILLNIMSQLSISNSLSTNVSVTMEVDGASAVPLATTGPAANPRFSMVYVP